MYGLLDWWNLACGLLRDQVQRVHLQHPHPQADWPRGGHPGRLYTSNWSGWFCKASAVFQSSSAGYAYGPMKLGMNGESIMDFKLNLLTYEIEGQKVADR